MLMHVALCFPQRSMKALEEMPSINQLPIELFSVHRFLKVPTIRTTCILSITLLLEGQE